MKDTPMADQTRNECIFEVQDILQGIEADQRKLHRCLRSLSALVTDGKDAALVAEGRAHAAQFVADGEALHLNLLDLLMRLDEEAANETTRRR